MGNPGEGSFSPVGKLIFKNSIISSNDPFKNSGASSHLFNSSFFEILKKSFFEISLNEFSLKSDTLI